jgi:hypothetical protein
VWHRGTAKQRLWLGPGRYLGRCNQRHTNSDADANSYADRDSNGYTDSASYANPECTTSAESRA